MDDTDLGLLVKAMLALRPGLDAISLAEALWLAASRTADGDSTETTSSRTYTVPKSAKRAISPPLNIKAASKPETGRVNKPPDPVTQRNSSPEEKQTPSARVRIKESGSPQTAAASQALRPFRQLWPTGRELELDVNATVRAYSRTRRLTPEFRPAPERWFDAEIVIDDSSTMQLWNDITTSVPLLFQQLGFFRTVRSWQLSVAGATPTLVSAAGLPTAPGQLQSSNARRLIVVVTDGGAAGWRRPEVWELLRSWSASTPTALLTPLATRLWERTGLALPVVRAGPGNRGTPNPGLRYSVPAMLPRPKGSNWIPLPIATFSPRMLGQWARTLMSGDPAGCHALLIPSADDKSWLAAPDTRTAERPTLDGANIVETFRKTASPAAARLALLCSPFADVGIPLLRAIGENLLPGITAADLPEVMSEVVLSGLLALSADTAPDSAPPQHVLRFHPEVQQHLRTILSELDAWRVYDLLSSQSEGLQRRNSHEILMFLDATPGNTREHQARAEDLPGEGILHKQETPDREASQKPPSSRNGKPPAIWGSVPTRNMNFTGRNDILELLRESSSGRATAVLPASGTPRSPESDPIPQGVHGLGGVGKTAIAAEYAWRYRSEYDLVWWIPAEQRSSVRGSLAELAQRLNLEAPPSTGIDGLIDAVREALRLGEPYRRWLLIFDNADQPEDLEGLIPTGPGDVLITSRNHRWESAVRTVSMNVFQPEESREFLLTRVRHGLTETEANRLAQELGHLPLALEQAGAMLSEGLMPADEYLRLLKEHTAEIMSAGRPASGYPTSMTAAWRLAVNAVDRNRPEALSLLRCCAFFGPEPIPRHVFRPGVQKAETKVGKILSSPLNTAAVLSELARYALITLSGNTVNVHRLIQALVRDELPPEEQQSYRREAQMILAAAVPGNPNDATTWPQFQALLPHVNAESAELHRSADSSVRGLVLGIIRYLYLSGDGQSALALAKRFLDQWTRDSGPDDEDVLRGQCDLGNVMRLLGQYAGSYRVTEEALRRANSALGENSPTALSLRMSFGADLRASGKFDAAREFNTETHTILERLYGPDDLRTLRSLTSIATDSLLTSQYTHAQDHFELAYRSMYGPGTDSASLDTLTAWIGIAWSLHLAGRSQNSFDVSRDALEYARNDAAMPEWHLSYLRAANIRVAASQRLPDEWHRALEIGEVALRTATHQYGDLHPDTIALMTSQSNLLSTMGPDYRSDALPLAQSAAYRCPDVYGQDHPYTYGCMVNLALHARESGNFDQARSLDDDALEGLRAKLGPDHHYTLIAAVNVATDLAASGRLTAATEIGSDAYNRLLRVLGETHPHSLACGANLALDLIASGDADSGHSAIRWVSQGYISTLGQDHPETQKANTGQRIDVGFDLPPI